MTYYNRTNTCDECGNKLKLEYINALREYIKGNWTGRWICRNCYDDKKAHGKYRRVHILENCDINIEKENITLPTKGTLGWIREQAKKDGFDNITVWVKWKGKQNIIERLKSKVRNIEQIEKFENKEFNNEYKYNFYRFWSKVDIKDNIKECWNWTEFISPDEYGYFKYYDAPVRAHRMSYELAKGNIDNNKIVMHLCNNRICCNPYHLEVGNYSKNLIYAYKCNRRNCEGENNTGAILTEDQVRKIHKLHKERPELKQWQIAKAFNIGQATISLIINGERWHQIYEEIYQKRK